MKWAIKMPSKEFLRNLYDAKQISPVITFETCGEAEEYAQNLELSNYKIVKYK